MPTRARQFYGWLSLLLMLGLCRLALAHPMGNFSVNHYSRITFESDRVRINYFIDLAEIPTYQELQQANISATLDRSEFRDGYQLRCFSGCGTGARSPS